MTTTQRIFKAVPINPSWTVAGTKLDLKAIYRRPSRHVGEYDEIIQARSKDGLPLYDLTGPLPMRRHSDWIAKGYEYVTVVASPHADDGCWPQVAAWLRHNDLTPSEFLQHPVFGTWNPKLYLDTAVHIDRARVDALRALVEKLGSQAVLDVKRSTDPSFTLPLELQNIPAGGLKNHAGRNILPHEEVAGPTPAVPPGSSAAKRLAAQKGAATKRAKAAKAGAVASAAPEGQA
jgi:hypothetical protein